MRMSKRGQGIGFTDLLFNALIGVTVMFILAIMLVNPPDPGGKIDTQAQITITLTWDLDSNSDIDLWVKSPLSIVSFRRREGELLMLDRDDLGRSNDTIIVGGRTVKLPYNQEVVSVRGIYPGRYFISVHTYRLGRVPGGFENHMDYKLTLEVLDLNPRVSRVFFDKITLPPYNQEEFMVAFEVDEAGDVTVIDHAPFSIREAFLREHGG